MTLLLIGLLLFLGAHSARVFAEGPRAAVIARLGANGWKGLYSVISLIGFVLIIKGYGDARGAAALWPAPPHLRDATALLVLAAFILLVAAYWPGNAIKAAVRDPMVLGVGCWALGHLLVKSSPPALALFGAFLVWAVVDFLSLRRRGQAAAVPDSRPAGTSSLAATAGTVVVGLIAFVGFLVWGHRLLIGVSPFG